MRGAYLFAIALSWEGLICGVEVLEDDVVVDEEVGLVSDEWVMIGGWGRVGINDGEEWTSKGIIDEVEGTVVNPKKWKIVHKVQGLW